MLKVNHFFVLNKKPTGTMDLKHEFSENICFLANGSEMPIPANLNIRRSGIHVKCFYKQDHTTANVQTEARRVSL